MDTKYNPASVESKWYQHWIDQQYFRSTPDEREAYTIVIPPPNVTGVLHMGHMLNNTIQDVLIRRARMQGYNACWVPGTDHASIATEAKVSKMLRERGINKRAIGREKFLEYAFEWKEKYGGIILNQLQKLGCSCDWERTRFTMEPKLSTAVIKVFVDLYNKGKIYRGLRITNWDPSAQTVLSNEEVKYSNEQSKLYHVRYKIADSDNEWVTIATTRPETILGDSAIAVNPKDERYAHLKGKQAIVPMVNRKVPIIFDSYVEMEFGTGALKVTPAHDTNDYDIGQRHRLETIDIFNANGTLSEAAQFYIGEDRFVVRKKIAKDLKAAGHLVAIEDYTNNVGRSERTNAVIEPRLTEQWFVNMKSFAATALEAVRSDEVTFYPKHFFNMYHNWLNENNIRDWCISRQLWWGQRVPAWYYQEHVFVAETAAEALQQAIAKTGNASLTIADLKQDDDALDTWFSSWLWPISVFDGFENQEELRYYYPTNVLVTGWDIMFFWVARMVMAGYEWSEDLLGADFIQQHGRQPFNDVYFTGMIRDNKRRKMSKSLGNSPDALALIAKYGADGVRYGVLSSAAAGNDIVFDAPIDKQKGVLNESKKCEQGRNFNNKMWNALRLIKGWEVTAGATNADNAPIIAWFNNKLQQIIIDTEKMYTTYRLSEVINTLYNFIWNDFCSVYLEMVKPDYGSPIDEATYQQTLSFYEAIIKLLHPFMPFITEEIYQLLKERGENDSICVSDYPVASDFDELAIKKGEMAKELMTKIRDVRNQKGLKQREPLDFYIRESAKDMLAAFASLLTKKAYLSNITYTNQEVENSVSFLVGKHACFIKLDGLVNKDEEMDKLKKEIAYYQGLQKKLNGKLSNQRFVNNAPAPVVEKERKKLADTVTKIQQLQESLDRLG